MKKLLLKVGANYLLLPLCMICNMGGALVVFVLPIVQLCLTITNYKWSSNLKYFILLQMNMLISTVVGNIAGAQLFLNYVSNDAESVIIFVLIFRAGVLVVLTLSIVFGIAKGISVYRNNLNLSHKIIKSAIEEKKYE